MKLINAMATVGGLTGLSRIAGFARDILTAAMLGAGPVADAFFVALKLPNFFRRVSAEGAFSVSFVPLYSGMLGNEGEDAANAFASRALSVMLWWLTGFVLLVMAAMPWVIYVIAPGFQDDPVRYDLAVELSRITFPYLLFISMTSLLGGVLNAHDKFAPFASAPILFNLCMVGFLLLSPHFETPGHALSWGVFAAGIVQFGLLALFVKRMRIRLRPGLPHIDGNIKRLLKLMGPGLIGAGVVHINLFADMIIASFLPEGSISYLYYADRLNQLPLGTVGIAVGTALLPMLSRAIAAGRHVEARHLFNRALEVCLVLALPAALGLMVAAGPIISVLFQRGAFSAHDASMAAMVLMGYALGLPAYIAVKVLSGAFWAQQDTASPVKVAVVSASLNIALAVVLSRFIGVAGISLATGIAGWVQFTLLYRGLRGQETVQIDERLRFVFPRIVMAAGLMAVTAHIITRLCAPLLAGGDMERVLALGAIVGGAAAVFGIGVTLTGALTPGDMKRYFKRKELKSAE
jgi:putative peptidoglycan lipid II flippase